MGLKCNVLWFAVLLLVDKALERSVSMSPASLHGCSDTQPRSLNTPLFDPC